MNALIIGLLLFSLILYEILVIEHKEKLEKFMIGAILALMSAFIFIMHDRLIELLL